MSGRLVLLRHGQSVGNVEQRLDTRPPGAELTPTGPRPGQRVRRAATPAAGAAGAFGGHPGGADGRGDRRRTRPADPGGRPASTRCRSGDLENRNDDEAVAEFNAIYERWQHGELDVPLPGGETANEVLDRYVPVLTDCGCATSTTDDWTGDIVVVSHGAAIRLVSAVLAGVDADFALDHHLGNTESVVLAPITDGRWSCVRWGTLTPPFYPDPVKPGHAGRRRGSVEHRPDGLSQTASADRFRAVAADRVAVEDERVREQLRADAVRLGAFRTAQRVCE